MLKYAIIWLGIIGLSLSAIGVPTADENGTNVAAWAIKADIAESCSCDPACPCMFGSPMTNDTCEGSRLYEIEKAHLGDARLDNLQVIATFRMGAWVKYYVSADATDGQLKAVAPLIARSSPVFDVEVLSVERARISVERTDRRVTFTGPTSRVEIELIDGLDGKPIEMQNLPYHDLANYVQYKSIENSHEGGEINFKYSGTNGFTSKVDARG